MGFNLKSSFIDRGDQPAAIRELSRNFKQGIKHQVLLGVTGSGKTYTMARVIQEIQVPTIVITHNKTLTAQLYSEFKTFFPDNAVEYFVSYYDYYQPEAYMPQTDTYIEKDASINERIDRLRLKATSSLLSRKDVIIVASVSCIYGLGSPGEWAELLVVLKKGEEYGRSELACDLVSIQYHRNDLEFVRGSFRVRGGVVDIFPAYTQDEAVRVKLEDGKISEIHTIHPLTGKRLKDYGRYVIYPARHFVTKSDTLGTAIESIKSELDSRLKELNRQKKFLEAQRLEMRTEYDLEMLQETGYCHGIENYSRHISGRKPGEPPFCLLNYFPDNLLIIIDESHVTLPQLRGMHAGDRSRKTVLVEHGFRLPSALDNRPLQFMEFEKIIDKIMYVSATPADYELNKSKNRTVEQIIRPTGLVDPEVEIRPADNQVQDLIGEIEIRAANKQRVLVTTLTKKMAEDLTEFLSSKKLSVRYLHSEIDTLQRISILKDLRKGEFDCLVGVNLLREGIDLPEVTLVAILDADKEGFLRSRTSLIQVCGRASRNVEGRVIMYAENITGSMARALKEMDRRREKQIEHNKKHNITPRSIEKSIREEKEFEYETKTRAVSYVRETGWEYVDARADNNIIRKMEQDMKEAADMLDFELAAAIRDKIKEM